MKIFRKKELNEIGTGILFISPAIILILLFIAYPIVVMNGIIYWD